MLILRIHSTLISFPLFCWVLLGICWRGAGIYDSYHWTDNSQRSEPCLILSGLIQVTLLLTKLKLNILSKRKKKRKASFIVELLKTVILFLFFFFSLFFTRGNLFFPGLKFE